MIHYQCDKCGAKLRANDPRRFIVKLEVYAAASPVDLDHIESEGHRDTLEGVLEALASADPDEIEDQTYRCFRFDLCDACRRRLIVDPLGGGATIC